MTKRRLVLAAALAVAFLATALIVLLWPRKPAPKGFYCVATRNDLRVAIVPTIHAATSPLTVPPAVKELLATADVLAVEVDATDASLAQAANMCAENLLRRMPAITVTAEAKQDLRQLLRQHGMDEQLVETQPHFVLASAVAQKQAPEWSANNGLDRQLIELVRKRGGAVEALETTCSPSDAFTSQAFELITRELVVEVIRDSKSGRPKACRSVARRMEPRRCRSCAAELSQHEKEQPAASGVGRCPAIAARSCHDAAAAKARRIEQGHRCRGRYATRVVRARNPRLACCARVGRSDWKPARLSKTAINPGQAQALLAAAQSQEPLYRIDVKLKQQDIQTYGERQPLRPGMALEADVVQDRRAVWEWVLEPVIAATAKAKVLSASPNKASPGG